MKDRYLCIMIASPGLKQIKQVDKTALFPVVLLPLPELPAHIALSSSLSIAPSQRDDDDGDEKPDTRSHLISFLSPLSPPKKKRNKTAHPFSVVVDAVQHAHCSSIHFVFPSSG